MTEPNQSIETTPTAAPATEAAAPAAPAAPAAGDDAVLKAIAAKAAELAPDAWESVKSYAAAIEMSSRDLVVELQSVLADPMLAKFKEGGFERYTLALGILQGRLEQQSRSNAKEWTVTVLGVGTVNTNKKHRVDVYAVGEPVDDKTNGKLPMRITFWEEDVPKAFDAKPGYTYNIFLSGGYKEGQYQTSADTNRTNWNSVVSDNEGVDLREIVLTQFPNHVPLVKLSENYSASWADQKVIDGIITDRKTDFNKNNEPWYKLSVIDNSLRSGEGSPLSIFVEKAHTGYAPGSRALFVGTAKPPKEGNEQYGPNFYLSFMAPTLAIEVPPLEPMKKAVSASAPANAPANASASSAKPVEFGAF